MADYMAEIEKLEDVASAGILHLLAVRENRRLRLWLQRKFTPEDPALANVWADEDMLEEKLGTRLLAPQVKRYLLESAAPRKDDDLIINPYYRQGMTAEMIKEQLESLTREQKIVPVVSTAVVFTTQDDAAAAIGKDQPRYRITDRGLAAAPGALARLQELQRFRAGIVKADTLSM